MSDLVWSRSDVTALASVNCGICLGLGLTPGSCAKDKDFDFPCNCVLRKIFAACLYRFRRCTEVQGRVVTDTTHRWADYSMTNEEYISDFLAVSKRALCPQQTETLQYKIFKFHFLYGADCNLVMRKLQLTITKKAFFDEVYRIMHLLGRRYRELEPYALFPTDEYFTPRLKNRMVTKGIQ